MSDQTTLITSHDDIDLPVAYGADEDAKEASQTSRDSLGLRHNGTSNFSTIMHIIKGNVGTGILAMPNALTHAGILVGTLGLGMLGIICIHCMHILVHCSRYLCAKMNKSKLDYAEVVEQSVLAGPLRLRRHSGKARFIVNVFLLITQFGFCCVYILFMAQNIQKIVMKATGTSSDNPLLVVYELALLPLIIPYVFIKNIKRLVPFSAFANVGSIIGLAIIFFYMLVEMPLQPVERLPLFAGWGKLPMYFGTAVYAFEGISLVLPLENKMRDPEAFPGIFGALNVGMTIVSVLYIGLGFYGYLQFGDEAAASITLNMPQDQWYGTAVTAIFAVCIFISYGIQFYVPMEILSAPLAKTRISLFFGPNRFNYIFRACCVFGTFLVAFAVNQYLDILISLIGAVASSALALIFPPMLEIITFWPEREQRKYFWVMCVKDVSIAALGLLGFVTGTYLSLSELVQKLSH